MNYARRGAGRPLLWLHGIGGSWRSWQTISDGLAVARDIIAVDLPGFGKIPPLAGPTAIGTLADAVTSFLQERDLLGIDAVGSLTGARLVLELARRAGRGGTARPRRVLARLGEAGALPQRGPVHQAVEGPATRDAGHRRQRGGAHGAVRAVLAPLLENCPPRGPNSVRHLAADPEKASVSCYTKKAPAGPLNAVRRGLLYAT